MIGFAALPPAGGPERAQRFLSTKQEFNVMKTTLTLASIILACGMFSACSPDDNTTAPNQTRGSEASATWDERADEAGDQTEETWEDMQDEGADAWDDTRDGAEETWEDKRAGAQGTRDDTQDGSKEAWDK